jgi:hypothetical protein
MKLGQVFVNVATVILKDFFNIELMGGLLGKSARCAFRKFHCEPQFPKDARIVATRMNWQVDIYHIIIESKEYPEVINPTELNLICHRDDIWKEKEKVSFT